MSLQGTKTVLGYPWLTRATMDRTQGTICTVARRQFFGPPIPPPPPPTVGPGSAVFFAAVT